ncbi:MAG: DUF4258 domain-containing protein [Saprospiraceae bacterium]
MEFPFDTLLFKRAISVGNILWRKHALEKMITRGISRDEVINVMENGEVIRQYFEDRPFPSALVLGFPENRAIHVVVSFDETAEQIFVITAYEPDLTIFEPDFKTKKN